MSVITAVSVQLAQLQSTGVSNDHPSMSEDFCECLFDEVKILPAQPRILLAIGI